MKPIASVPEAAADNSVAITMDMEGETGTEELLKALKRHNAKMTFFICGNWGKRNKELIRRILDEGHELANHTMSHRWLTKINPESMKDEINDLESLVVEATGYGSTLPLLRPPGGLKNAKVEEVARDLGYRLIMWNVSAGDAVLPRPSASTVLPRLRVAKPGSIILTHSFCRGSIDAIIQYLAYLDKKGMRAITVSELILKGEKWASENPATDVSPKQSASSNRKFGAGAKMPAASDGKQSEEGEGLPAKHRPSEGRLPKIY